VYRSEWRNDITLFSDYGLNSEYYHPFTPQSHWFIAPRGLADNDPLYIYDNNQLVSTYRRSTLGGGIDVGYQFGNTGELRVGYEGGWQDFERQVGNPNELPSFSGGYGVSKLQYKLDRLDDPVIPRAGQSFQGDFYWYNASPAAPKPYPVLEAAGQVFFKLNEPTSIFLNGLAGTTFNYATGIPQFSLHPKCLTLNVGDTSRSNSKLWLWLRPAVQASLAMEPRISRGCARGWPTCVV
jgi:NTE family protein